MMSTRISLLLFLLLCISLFLGTHSAFAETPLPELRRVLSDKAPFDGDDFAQLQQGETVVKLFPVQNDREIAVGGLTRLNVTADEFLRSYRETVVQKGNPAILEIGSFAHKPIIKDLQSLTIESSDIEDLKECVVGHCAMKLSRPMIERLQKEINWEASDYQLQVSNLFKRMLLDYVNDYLARGEAALIAYEDKATTIHLAKEQRALLAAAIYSPDTLSRGAEHLQTLSKAELHPLETAIVWSKINIGLKPVIAINQITIYKRDEVSGPQILITSKQLYANHYFDSSVAVTAFVNLPGSGPYLYYENRSRIDGFTGFLGKMKRSVVETKAVETLREILENSKLNIGERALTLGQSETSEAGVPNWKRWKLGGAHLIFWFLLFTGLTALLLLSNYSPKSDLSR